jgi:hypothetical protein
VGPRSAARSAEAGTQVELADVVAEVPVAVAHPELQVAGGLGDDGAAEHGGDAHQLVLGMGLDERREELAELGLVDLAVVELVLLERAG